MTEEINETDNINAGAKRLVHTEDILSELIKEIYFDVTNPSDKTHSAIPGDGISRFDKLSEALYNYKLYPRTGNGFGYEGEFERLEDGTNPFLLRNGKFLNFKKSSKPIAGESVEYAEGNIPSDLVQYDDYANTIDIIIDALGDQWYRKTSWDSTNEIVSKRFTKNISERLEKIEGALDTISNIAISYDTTDVDGQVIHNKGFFEKLSYGSIIGPTSGPNSIDGKEPIDVLLSKLADYLGSDNQRLDLNDTDVKEFGSTVDNSQNIAAGLRNLRTRLENLEKYQAIIKATIGNNIYGNIGGGSLTDLKSGSFNPDTGTYPYNTSDDAKTHLLYKDLQAIKTTIWGDDNKYFSFNENDSNGDFIHQNNIFEILTGLLSPIKKLDNTERYYKFNDTLEKENLAEGKTLLGSPDLVKNAFGNGVDRISVIEKEIYNLRSFLGLEGRYSVDGKYPIKDEVRYKYNLVPEVESLSENSYAGKPSQVNFVGYSTLSNPKGDNEEGYFENDSILNELLFNINSVKILRGNVGTNEDLLDYELKLDDTSENFSNPKISAYEINLFEYKEGESLEKWPNTFRNAFLRQIKLKPCDEGKAVSSVTERLKNISEYLIGMGGYLTDRFDYFEGLNFIGKSSWWESIPNTKILHPKVNNEEVIVYCRNDNERDFISLMSSKDTPIDINNYFEVLNDFISTKILGKTSPNPLYYIQRKFTTDGIEKSVEYDRELFFIGTEPYTTNDGEQRYHVYDANGKTIGSTSSINYHDAISVNDLSLLDKGKKVINVISLQTVYKVVKNDKTLKFNGKNYAINNEGTYKNLIEEVIVHNKLLQDIISYIDKDTSTAESTTPTTESLI